MEIGTTRSGRSLGAGFGKRMEPFVFLGLFLVSVSAMQVMGSTDFVCKIRAAGNGGDFTSLTLWKNAVKSNLTLASSKVFQVSNVGSYVAADNGGAVTFSGGGTGTLRHINTSNQAYIVGCTGLINTGTVTLDVGGNTFEISDTGDQIGVAGAECYNDWPSGLADTVRIDGFAVNSTHFVKVYTPESERHTGVPKAGGVYTGFTLIGGAVGTRLQCDPSYMRLEGIAVDLRGISWNGISMVGSKSECSSCLVFNGHSTRKAFNSTRSATFRNCIAIGMGTGFSGPSSYTTTFYNCTSVNMASYGFSLNTNRASIVKNCIATGSGVQDFYDSDADTNNVFESCVSSDGSADDAWLGVVKATAGTTTGGVASQLIDAGASFTSTVLVGMRVKNTTDDTYANVTAVDSDTQLTLNADIFTTTEGYEVGKVFMGATPSYLNTGSSDFHLAPNDSIAKDKGTDLSGAATFPFTDDIDGETRSGTWDIGADEELTTVPEIDVAGNSTSITNGDTVPSATNDTDFGSADITSGTVTHTFTIANSGTAILTLSGAPLVAVSGTNDADFTVTVVPVSPVAVSGTTTFQVEFNPSALGDRTATLSIANDDADENPYTFAIKGTGTSAPEMDVQGNATSIASGDATPSAGDDTDFGGMDVVSGTVVRTFTIENTGSLILTLSGAPLVDVSGANASDFVVTAQPTSPVATAGGTTTFQITFDPSALGTLVALVSIDNDDADENPYTFSIQGIGIPPGSPPVAGDVTYFIENTNVLSVSTATGLDANSSDPDGDTLTYSSTGGPANGVLVLNPDGSFTYTPTAGFVGNDSFTYVANDGFRDSNVGTVTLTVLAPLDPVPGATPAVVALGDSTSLTSNPVGGSGTYVSWSWSGPDGFSSTLQNPGFVTPSTNGFILYTVTVTDSLGFTGTGTVNISVIESGLQPNPTIDTPLVPLGESVNLSSNPTGGTGVYVAYQWTGPNGYTSTVKDPGAYLPSHPGSFTFTLTVTDASGLVATDSVELLVGLSLASVAIDKGGVKYKIHSNTLSTGTDPNPKDKVKLMIKGLDLSPGDRLAFQINGIPIGDLTKDDGLTLDSKGRATGQLGSAPNIWNKVKLKYRARKRKLTFMASKGNAPVNGRPMVLSNSGVSPTVLVVVLIDRAPADGKVDLAAILPVSFKVKVHVSAQGVRVESGRHARRRR